MQRSRERSMIERTVRGATRMLGDGAGHNDDARADSLTVTDNRTGKTYELPIGDGTVRALDLREIKAQADDFGLMSYDPAYMNTASCRSAITYIDGEAGGPPPRGHPPQQPCHGPGHLPVAYPLVLGRPPPPSAPVPP